MDRPGARAVIVEAVLEAVSAVGDTPQQFARPRLGMVEDGVGHLVHRLAAVLGEQGAQAGDADGVGVRLGAQVAAQLLRQADVAHDHAQQVLVPPAGADQLHRQDADAFGEGVLGPLHALRPRHDAAHVDVVRRVDDVTDQRTLVVEHRLHEEEVREVPRAEGGVVGDDDVARLQRLHRDVVQHVLHGERHRAEMAGREVALGDHPAEPVEDGGGEVVALAHGLRKRGAA